MNGFPAPNKEPTTNQNHYLTAKAPYKFESGFLQRLCPIHHSSMFNQTSNRLCLLVPFPQGGSKE
jgi:hypothetical protein